MCVACVFTHTYTQKNEKHTTRNEQVADTTSVYANMSKQSY